MFVLIGIVADNSNDWFAVLRTVYEVLWWRVSSATRCRDIVCLETQSTRPVACSPMDYVSELSHILASRHCNSYIYGRRSQRCIRTGLDAFQSQCSVTNNAHSFICLLS